MPALVSNKLKFILPAVLMWLLPLAVLAVQVNHAELVPVNGKYLLSSDLDYQLSPRAVKALQSGVPLFWDIKVVVSRYRSYLWNKEVANRDLRFRIQYNALLNLYQVRNENSGNTYSFSTLGAALSLMSTLRNIYVVDVDALADDENYYAAVKVKLDRDALPLPLRPAAYTNSQWYLASDWYEWLLKK